MYVCIYLSVGTFSFEVDEVEVKHGYVGSYNGLLAQQESGAVLSKNSMFTGVGVYIKLSYKVQLLYKLCIN